MPPNDPRVPRRVVGGVSDHLDVLKASIEATHRAVSATRETTLDKIRYQTNPNGQQYDRQADMEKKQAYEAETAHGYYGNQASEANPPHTATLRGGISSGVGVGPRVGLVEPSRPGFTPPIVRVVNAYGKVREARKRLENVAGVLIGGMPENCAVCDAPDDPNPWGGMQGEVANYARMISEEVDRMNDLMLAIESSLP